jgi:hypothetical protein
MQCEPVSSQSATWRKRYGLLGLSRFRQVGERYIVMQVESESTLVNQGSKQIDANNIVPFARKAAPVAA